jgi:hypothetical protein
VVVLVSVVDVSVEEVNDVVVIVVVVD